MDTTGTMHQAGFSVCSRASAQGTPKTASPHFQVRSMQTRRWWLGLTASAASLYSLLPQYKCAHTLNFYTEGTVTHAFPSLRCSEHCRNLHSCCGTVLMPAGGRAMPLMLAKSAAMQRAGGDYGCSMEAIPTCLIPHYIVCFKWKACQSRTMSY